MVERNFVVLCRKIKVNWGLSLFPLPRKEAVE